MIIRVCRSAARRCGPCRAPSATLRRPPPATVVRPLPQPDDSLAETLRKLWRRKKMIAAVTIVLGGAAAAIAWSMPSFYTAEARVLVGVQSPRVFNAEAIITDSNPDAERVQNEGYVLQSRTLAMMVIDKLKLDQNPSFNPELRKPSMLGAHLQRRPVPAAVGQGLAEEHAHQGADATGNVTPITDNSLSPHDNRMIDIFLGKVDVSLLGRSHVLSVKADALDPDTASAMANTLADDLSRLPAQGQGRDDGPGRQVPDGTCRRAARAGEEVRPGGRGLSPRARPVQGLGHQRQRDRPAAHRAQYPADRRPDRQGRGRIAAAGGAGRQQGRGRQQGERARGAAFAADLRAQGAGSRCRPQGGRGRVHVRQQASPAEERAGRGRLRGRAGQRRGRQDRRRPRARRARRRCALPDAQAELRHPQAADGRGERQFDRARGARARRHGQPQPARGDAESRQAEHRRRGDPAGQRQAGLAGRAAGGARLSAQVADRLPGCRRRLPARLRDRPDARERRRLLPPRRPGRDA